MTWNCRLIRTDHATESTFAVHEVFYDAKGAVTLWTEEPVDVTGTDREDVAKYIELVAQAVSRPALQVVGKKLVECVG